MTKLGHAEPGEERAVDEADDGADGEAASDRDDQRPAVA